MSKLKDTLKQDNFLLYVPQKKHRQWEERNGKVYLVFHHDRAAEKFLRWLVKKPYVSDVELDELGSTTWKLIDGENTVHIIAEKLVEKYGDKCQPVYDRLIMYMRYLNKKGWIAFERGEQE